MRCRRERFEQGANRSRVGHPARICNADRGVHAGNPEGTSVPARMAALSFLPGRPVRAASSALPRTPRRSFPSGSLRERPRAALQRSSYARAPGAQPGCGLRLARSVRAGKASGIRSVNRPYSDDHATFGWRLRFRPPAIVDRRRPCRSTPRERLQTTTCVSTMNVVISSMKLSACFIACAPCGDANARFRASASSNQSSTTPSIGSSS